MAKNTPETAEKETKTPENAPKTSLKKAFYKLLFWLVLVLVVVGLWKNPVYVKNAWQWLLTQNQGENAPKVTVESLALQVENLQNQLAALQKAQENLNRNVDAEALNQRMDAIEKVNLNVIDSKADIATVFGMVNRLDKMDERLQTLTKFTDESALILTATMLVKDSAERGNEFVYEAEILRQIADKNQQVGAQVAVLAKYAPQGISTNAALINEFESIYNALLKEQKETFEQSWKDRINSKLNEIVKIKRIKEDAPEFAADQNLEEVLALVKTGEFAKAVSLLEKNESKLVKENAALKNWVQKAQAKIEFEKAVAEIATYSLAKMKVNFIKKETGND